MSCIGFDKKVSKHSRKLFRITGGTKQRFTTYLAMTKLSHDTVLWAADHRLSITASNILFSMEGKFIEMNNPLNTASAVLEYVYSIR